MKRGNQKSNIRMIRSILLMAIPLIIEQLVYQVQSLTDQAFLGNLETEYVSAVGAAQAPYGVTVNFIFGLSTGLVILISQLWGSKNREEIQRYFKSSALYFSLISIAIFIFWMSAARPVLIFFQVDKRIVDYSVSYIQISAGYLFFMGIDIAIQSVLLGMGRTKPIMYAAIIKVVMNILISWVLVFGYLGFPALYVAGAAIGTLVADILACIFLTIYCIIFLRNDFMMWTKWSDVYRIEPFGKVIRLGIPAGLEFLLWHFSNLMLLRFVNGFSYLATGMYTLTYGLQCFAGVFYQGTCNAALTMVGQSIGAGDKKKANRVFYSAIVINATIIVAFAILFCILPEQLLSIFSNDPELIHMGAGYMPFVALIMFPQSMNLICGSAIRAHKDTKWMLYSQMIGSTLIISMSWLFVEVIHMHMVAIYLTVFIDESIRGLVNYIYYRKKYEGK